MVRTRTSSGGGARRSGHRRIADCLTSDEESSGDECFYTPRGYFDEMPDFFGDQSDLVEVTLELEEDSMVVRNVTPTSAAAAAAAMRWDSVESLSRSSSASTSTTSRIRRKFAWLMSPLPRQSLASMMAAEDEEEAAAAAAASGSRFSFSSGGVGVGVGRLAPREARRIKARLERSRSGAKRALKGLRFISRTTVGAGPADAVGLWRKVEERFTKLSKDGLLSRDDFGECIGMVDSKEFAKGLFDALARRRRQTLHRINKEELHDFWLQISDQSFDARLQIFFDMVDTNEDGRITREEVQELIILSASANKLSKLKEQAQEYAALIMEELDPENLGYIELWQLEELLLQRDRYMNYSRPMSTGSAAQWSQNITTGGPARPPRQTFTVRRTAARLRVAARENWRRAWVVALWLAAMGALFVWKFTQYRRREAFEVMGYCLTTAKGAAETLKLNMALVLLPVCRNTLTWLRSTRARLFVPFDDNITFHKMIATAIVAGILLHAGNHLLCDFPRLINASPEKYALVAGDFGENARPTYKGLVSGVEGVTGVAMVVLMSISFTLATHRFRKNGARLPFPLNRLTGFNAFWYSHHLLAVVYLLLLIHGYFLFLVHKWYQRTTWMYIAIPLLIYVGERHLRAFRSKAYSVKILKVSLLPGSVLTLTMSKPHGFRYRSGQYIFLQCPTISPFEWHPFSITSAPGDDCLSVHIRTNGDWTEELKHIFIENYFAPGSSARANNNFNRLGAVQQKSLPRLLVDGPYGAPAQDFRNYDVLLLVGLGIGATPFISILRDLLNNIKLEDELMDLVLETSRSDYSYNVHSLTSSGSSRKRSYRTSSAHFYWVTREPGSFEWFKGVMNEVAEMDKKGIIEMHNYLTSVYEERDARTTLLTMVQALNHAKTGVDIVSGTRVRTHFARPNWREVFSKLASKHPGARIGVFYCGTPTLSKELRNLSHEMSHRTSTRFHFHKEYF